jgi:hypothetical protein
MKRRHDAVGLPPGDGMPHGRGRPEATARKLDDGKSPPETIATAMEGKCGAEAGSAASALAGTIVGPDVDSTQALLLARRAIADHFAGDAKKAVLKERAAPPN